MSASFAASGIGERVDAIVERYRPAVREAMQAALRDRRLPLYAAMRYHLGWEDASGNPAVGRGGKLLRPALCLLSCEAVGGDWKRAVPAAAGVEFLHNFTLVHDDIQDASPKRHGRDTVWNLWGQAQAINVGDGLYALAHQEMLRLAGAGAPPEVVVGAIGLLDEATLRLCEGQFLDISYEDEPSVPREAYLAMIGGKTAALMAASAAIGALVGGGGERAIAAFREAGRLLGLAFQVRDDVLGIWGDPKDTGKATGEDIRARKKTYPIVHTMESASPAERARLRELYAAPRLKREAFDEIVAILERARAREEAEAAAAGYAEEALAAIEGLDLRDGPLGDLGALAAHFARRPR